MSGEGKALIHDDFVLENEAARELYHGYAEGLPIIDYHCHLAPDEIAMDQRWENLTQVWLYGDHYKWRAMRSNGIAEELVTGPAGDRERFDAWAETMPMLLRNPLFHWTQLELSRYFGVDEVLSPKTADAIWERGVEKLAEPGMSARGLIKQSKVEAICTTDDPTDSLEYHKAIAADRDIEAMVLPTWRPDKALAVDRPEFFNAWVDRLAEVSGVEIDGYVSFMAALENRHDYFAEHGCRLADHGTETFYADDFAEGELGSVFARVRGGEVPEEAEIARWRSAVMHELGLMNAAKGWVQQFHFGALRNNNTRMFEKLGPDAGFDSMGDLNHGAAMSKYFDRLDSAGSLAKTILYNLNPKDNALVGAMLGNFQDGSVAGKMQMGSGWWFLDTMDGMERQMEDLSNLGLISRFVGMLTDSRSFTSYTRHEYFRRILCNVFGRDIERGLIPRDFELVGGIVRGICYENAASFFEFGDNNQD